MEALGLAIGFYAILLNHLVATSLFLNFYFYLSSGKFGFFLVIAILLSPIFWFGAILNLAGSIIIRLYFFDLTKRRREYGQLQSSASGY